MYILMLIYKTNIFIPGLQKTSGGFISPGRGTRSDINFDLLQGSANGSLQAKSNPLPVFDNKAGLEQNHMHSLRYLQLLLCWTTFWAVATDIQSMKPKIFTSWPFKNGILNLRKSIIHSVFSSNGLSTNDQDSKVQWLSQNEMIQFSRFYFVECP